jgi:hypothetical protein
MRYEVSAHTPMNGGRMHPAYRSAGAIALHAEPHTAPTIESEASDSSALEDETELEEAPAELDELDPLGREDSEFFFGD